MREREMERQRDKTEQIKSSWDSRASRYGGRDLNHLRLISRRTLGCAAPAQGVRGILSVVVLGFACRRC